MPRALAEVRFRRVPFNALVVTVVAALALLLLGDLKTLASATDAPVPAATAFCTADRIASASTAPFDVVT